MSIHKEIIIVDCGSQYTGLILRRVREIGCFAKLVLMENLYEEINSKKINPVAFIISGSPSSTMTKIHEIDFLIELEVPILGICYGFQLLANYFSIKVSYDESKREYGNSNCVITEYGKDHALFKDFSDNSPVWMSHSDSVLEPIPNEVKILAKNPDNTIIAVEFSKNILGVQFHPEVSHTENGIQILKNFIGNINEDVTFNPDVYKEEIASSLKKRIKGKKIVCGVSGGVDSTVLATLLNKVGADMECLFINNGFLRENEEYEVAEQFKKIGIDIRVIDAREEFLKAISGVYDPEKKRKIIGDLFIKVFFDNAKNFDILAQGTLFPDIIESATSGSKASVIKTHHNRVEKILQLKEEDKVIEPLSELFKDEVRSLGSSLNIPLELLNRHPFPGPGLAIRVIGEVTEEKLKILREADTIFIRILKETDWYDKIWQAYAALLPIRTVGVKGDERNYEHPIVLRAVKSVDAMTANCVDLPFSILEKITTEILNKITGVNRVFYDISSKPPSSIELE